MEISPLTLKILHNRGISTKKDIEEFLYPSISNLSDPFSIPEVKKACERIYKAILKKEKIFIYGDGDVDGICCVFFLIKLFEKTKSNFSWYLTHRLEDYEIEETLIEKIKKENFSLLITADYGISSVKALKKAHNLRIQTIVLDHHRSDKNILPDFHIYVNPFLYDFPASLKNLSGCGIVFKIIEGMETLLPGLKEKKITNFLEMVALSIIGDSSSLIGENRVFIKEGLNKLNSTEIPGLKNLLEKLNIYPTYYNIFLKLNPKLNSPGRFGMPEISLNLFLNEDEKEIACIIREIEELDRKRTSLVKNKIQKIENELDKNKWFVISDNFLPSLCGIIASRFSEKYKVPTLICSKNGEIIQGSGRSPNGFSLYDELAPLKKHFISFGGHSNAIGVKFQLKFLNFIKNFWEEIVNKYKHQKSNFHYFDEKLDLESLTPDIVKEISLLEPFGCGNPSPHFLEKSAQIQKIIKKENKNIKFWIKKNNKLFECIMEKGEMAEKILPGKKINFIYTPHIKEISGFYRIWLEIKDIL